MSEDGAKRHLQDLEQFYRGTEGWLNDPKVDANGKQLSFISYHLQQIRVQSGNDWNPTIADEYIRELEAELKSSEE